MIDASHSHVLSIANQFEVGSCFGSFQTVDATYAGMSGGKVFRVSDSSGSSVALKHYSGQQKVQRVREIHRWINQLADLDDLLIDHRFPICGSGHGTVFFNDGVCWELSNWIEGRPLDSDASINHITAGAASIRWFHDAASRLGTRTECSLSIKERCMRLDPSCAFPEAEHLGSIVAVNQNQRLFKTLLRASRLLSERWAQVCKTLRPQLLEFSGPRELQLVLRDIHREHLLFRQTESTTEDSSAIKRDAESERSPVAGGDVQASGLIDFDAMRFDVKELDFSRWIGSFDEATKDFNGLLERVVGGAALADRSGQTPYSGLQMSRWEKDGIKDLNLDLIRLLHQSGVWIGIANWVTWLAQGREFPAGFDAVTARINRLCDQADP